MNTHFPDWHWLWAWAWLEKKKKKKKLGSGHMPKEYIKLYHLYCWVLLVIGNLGIDASCRWKCRGAKSMEFETNGWMEDKIRVIIKSREACMSHHHDMLHDYVMPRHGIHYRDDSKTMNMCCLDWIGCWTITLDWLLVRFLFGITNGYRC